MPEFAVVEDSLLDASLVVESFQFSALFEDLAVSIISMRGLQNSIEYERYGSFAYTHVRARSSLEVLPDITMR